MAQKRRRIIQHIVQNPFEELALGLSADKIEDEIWEEKPVSIQEFIEGEEYLNLKWNGRIGCRPEIMKILKKVSQDHIREAVLLLGKGSGKDYSAAILHCYGIYKCLCMRNPQGFYGLSRRSKIYFVNTARNDQQARKVFFEEFRGMVEDCPWFEGQFSEPTGSSIFFAKRIEAISVNSQAFGWLGYNTIQWVGDELAFFLENDKDEESDSRAEECWEAAYGSCSTRFGNYYKMIGITTPRYDDDFVMKKFYELQDRPDGYAIQKATWNIHPDREKKDYYWALTRNYRRAMRDFGAVPSGVIESFWADPDFVENNICQQCRQCPVYQNRGIDSDIYSCWDYDKCKVNAYMGNGRWREWFKPEEDKEIFIHFDLSKNKDRVGFSVGYVNDYIQVELDLHVMKEKAEKEKVELKTLDDDDRFEEKPMIKICAIGTISPASKRDSRLTKNGEIYYTGILKHIIVTLIDKGFEIGTISFDQFQSHMLKQSLEDMGIDVELISLDRNDTLPVQAKLALTENRVEYPYSKLLCDEARHLKYIKGKKVDHAKKKSKDVWDGFAGTIADCENYSGGSKTFAFEDDEEDDD